MTPEEQRIAIAEACGWINQGAAKKMPALGHRWLRPGTMNDFTNELPNYLNDLNAMHEAENHLLRVQVPDWERQLRKITMRDADYGVGLYERLIRATAGQRAEAFLRTIGKWKIPEKRLNKVRG